MAQVRRRLGARDPGAVVGAAREAIADERARLQRSGAEGRPIEELADEVVARLDGGAGRSGLAGMEPVINATGVILHTNLGRAPWPKAAIEAAGLVAGGYALLELDRATGKRGPRSRLAEDHLVALTGAEDALIVNNNAAAVAIAVGLAGRSGVVVSRGELVEIGGGVRIPEIVRRTGARLIEVGTTNRTRADDFREPLESGRAKVVLRVHPSNFRQTGFVETPDTQVLVDLAHAAGAVVVDDLGSGALLDTARFGLPHEPTPSDALAAGADVVTFSGDKLVGGPQVGLVVGRAGLIARLRKDPLARAARPDKAIAAAVAATLALYRGGLATREVPVWRMIATTLVELRERAARLAEAGGPEARPRDMTATIGGGSLPGTEIPSAGVAIRSAATARILAALRAGSPPVVGRVEAGEVLLDLRTVDPADDGRLAAALRRVLPADAGDAER